ncbi:retrovirus-related pol polyprotein from transposon TNT 1-94 [Tanacetum coccineum]
MSSYSIPYGSTRDSSSSTCFTIQNHSWWPDHLNLSLGYRFIAINCNCRCPCCVPTTIMEEDEQEKGSYNPRFIKLIIADLMKKFPNIPKRIEEDYHSIKDDVPLVAVPMNQPQPVVSTQGTHRITPSAHRSPTVSTSPLESKKRKQTAEKSSSPRNTSETLTSQEEFHTNNSASSRVRLRKECRRQGYMIQDMERKCVTIEKFWETHNKIDEILHEVVMPSDQKEDDFHSQHDEHQDDDAPPKGEKRVKRSKGSKRSKFARDENVIDEDEVIPEDETIELIAEFQNINKRVPTIFDHARIEATLRDTLSNQWRNAKEYAYHLEQSTNFMENQIYGNTKEKKYILSLHKIYAEEFLKPDLEEELNRWVRKEFKTFNEDALLSIQHWKDSWHKNFMDQILVMRSNDKPYNFSEADFKYLNKNNVEDIYYLCRSKKVDNRKIKLMNSLITFIRSFVIWERVYDFQLGIESYQIRVNLTAPTLTFPGIKEHAPHSIVDKPQIGLIYLNSKDEKRVQTVFIQLEEAVKQYYIVNIVVNSSEIVNSSVDINDYVNVNVNFIEMCNKCLDLEAKLFKQHNMVEKDEYNKLLKSYSQLEQHCISLEIAMPFNKEIFQKNNTSVNQTEPTFDQLFELNNLKAKLQEKDTTIKKLKDIVDNAAQVSNATTIAPGMYKLNPVTLDPTDKNNREAHIYYLKHTMEQAAILREIVEQAKSLNPLDSASYSACKYVKLIQELLGYVRNTFPNIHKPSKKLVGATPINKKKTVSSMFYARHKLCFVECVSDMNASSKSNSVTKAKKKEEWKPTRKVFTKIRYNLRPTGRTFTLVGNACPLAKITATNKVPLREPIPLEVVAEEPVVTKVYTRRPKVPKTISSNSKPKIVKSMISNKTKPGTSRGSNTSVAPSSSSLVDLSINRKKYILVIVDDYTQFTWVKFLASKDEAPDFIIKFLKMIQVRLNATVRNIRTDNGTMFVNQTLRSYYESVGISHETSIARSL